MGKKKKKTKAIDDYGFTQDDYDMFGFDEDEEDSFESGDEDIFGFNETSNNGGLNNMDMTGVLETNPFMMRNNMGGMGMGMQPLTQPDFKELQRNNIKDRVKNVNITKKELKKVKKKIENGNVEVSKLLLKDGESLTKKEKKLLDKINIIRLAQGNEMIQILDEIETNDKIKILKEKYKVYKCSCDYIDRDSLELEFNDFCEYAKIHGINELFMVESAGIPLIKIDSTPWNDTEYIKLKKDIKTWNRILDKMQDAPSDYIFMCYENNFKVSTKINTGCGISDFMTDDIFILHKEELLDESTFGSM